MKKIGVRILIVIALAALFNWVIYPDSCYLKAIPVECHDDEGNTDTCSVYSMENVCERHRITEELLLKYQKDMQNPEIIDDCVTVDGEDSCVADIDEPVVEEVNIPTFEELNNVVDKCDDDSYDYNVYQKAYILPYKDGYIGYQLGGQDGWELYLTYRKLGEPCNIIAQSDNIFWWNPWYKEGQETFRGASYPDNKIYISQGLFSGVPTEEIAKELNCEPGKNFEDQDHTCTEEAEKYFYDLMVGNEENEYFTQWMNKLKEDIDNEDYKTFSYYREEYDTCSQKVVDLIGTIQPNQDEKARGEYQVKRTENMHDCVLENLNK